MARLLQGYFSQVTVAPHLVDDDVEYLLVSVDYKHMESKASLSIGFLQGYF
jgi:hypothetical protein